jgi:hypothetical protein
MSFHPPSCNNQTLNLHLFFCIPYFYTSTTQFVNSGTLLARNLPLIMQYLAMAGYILMGGAEFEGQQEKSNLHGRAISRKAPFLRCKNVNVGRFHQASWSSSATGNSPSDSTLIGSQIRKTPLSECYEGHEAESSPNKVQERGLKYGETT